MGAAAASGHFQPHSSTCFIDFAEQFGTVNEIAVEVFWPIVLIKLEHFDLSASIPWEQRLPVGLSDLIHPTDLLIPQSNLARRNRSVRAAAEDGPSRPHPTTYNIDFVELFGAKRSVGAVVAGGLFRA